MAHILRASGVALCLLGMAGCAASAQAPGAPAARRHPIRPVAHAAARGGGPARPERGAAAGASAGHRRHHLQPRRRTPHRGGPGRIDAGSRPRGLAHPRAVPQRGQQPDHRRAVAAAVEAHQRPVRRGSRPGRRGGDQRDRHPGGDGVLPASHRTRRATGRRGRLDAHPQHTRLRRRRQPPRGRSRGGRAVGAWPRACWSC